MYKHLCWADRARLSGMQIGGYTSPGGSYVSLYKDDGRKTTCGTNDYGDTGTSICGDILLIPITNTGVFSILRISTANYLTLCEVQVFAGR